MVECMIRKNAFIIGILILYLLFLSKDHLLGFFDNRDHLTNFIYDEKLEYYKEEYESMKELINIDVDDYSVIYSKILFRDIYAFYNELTIGAGSLDGVKHQDLVVNELGVVGVISEVNKHTSTVELITDPEMQLSVRIGESYGILTSIDNQIVVKNVKLSGEVNVGDSVFTSGLTSIPGNMLVGTVKKIKTDDLELEYILEVEATIQLNDISYVAIIGGQS